MSEIGVVSNGRGPATQLENRSFLTSEQFLNLLLTELTTQDPTKPLSNEDMMRQIAAIQQLQSNTQLSEVMTRLAQDSSLTRFEGQFTSAVSMIGRVVTGEDEAGQEVRGTVTRVVVEDGAIMMYVLQEGQTDPVRIPYTNVVSVEAVSEGGE